jgi:molybdenum cofactor cytidylyltransferase
VQHLSGDAPSVVVLILAAGRGERFKASGAQVDKLNAPLGSLRVRDHVLRSVQASGLPWHIVEREHTQHLVQPGMGDSIACGVAATADAQGWLILPADLPLVLPATLLAVAQALKQHPVVVPFYQGKKGHPVGFDASCGAALRALQGDEGARSVVAQRGAWRLEVSDPGCVLDVDTLDALAQAEVLMQRRGFAE